MDYCLNIDTNKYKNTGHNMINFSFLDCIKDNLHKYDNLYKLLNNDEEFKMKNIYNYIYNRVLSLHNLYNIGTLEKIHIRENITYDNFNDKLFNYINNDIVKTIIIINSIQQYYKPLRNI